MEEINVAGETFQGYSIPTGQAMLLVIRGKSGLLGCGYLSVETADRLGDRLAVVTGVKSFDDMLQAPVRLVSRAAAAAGVTVGMSGREALLLL